MTLTTIHAGRVVPLVDSNEHARQLQILDARIILGPLLTRDGKFLLVPSPRFHIGSCGSSTSFFSRSNSFFIATSTRRNNLAGVCRVRR
jgi:hypothetical protein